MIDKIINMLLKNKDKIEYVGERYPDTGHYYLFRIYFNKRNLFGFRKYLDIISWDCPDDKELLDIRIEIPSWNIFKYLESVDIEEDAQLSKIIKDIYHKAIYDEDVSICKHIEQILDDNLQGKRRKR